MNNTLKNGSIHIYIKEPYHEIEQFDIIICQIEELNTTVIKRVVAGPGDSLKINDGQIYVNGEYVEQDFDYIPGDVDVEKNLGIDQYYVLGDNRPNSVDSRSFGVVEQDDIKGTLLI